MDYTIADRLAALRRSHGYSQEGLAEKLGLTRQAVSRWERGESLPDTENLIALADLYGVSLDELVRPGAAEGEATLGGGAAPTEELLAGESEPAEVVSPISEAGAEDAVTEDVPAPEATTAATAASAEPAEQPEPLPTLAPEPSGASPEAVRAAGGAVPPDVVVPGQEPRGGRTGGWLAKALVGGCLVIVVGLALAIGGGCALFRWDTARGPVAEHSEDVAGPDDPDDVDGPADVEDGELDDGEPADDDGERGTDADDPDGDAEAGRSASATPVVSSMGSPQEVLIDESQVESLSIDWAAGPVEVVVGDASDGGILVTEEYLDDEAARWPMKVEVENRELEVSYAQGRTPAMQTGKGKRLTVRLPRSLAASLSSVECDLAAGSLEMGDLVCQALDLELASGTMKVAGVTARSLSVEVASGDAEVTGSFTGQVEMDLASGKLRVSSDVVPGATEIDVASGDAVLILPADAGFTANVDKSLGSFRLDFEARQSGDTYAVGGGGSPITVEIASGNVRIRPR